RLRQAASLPDHELAQNLLRRLRLGLGSAREAPHETARDAVIFRENGARQKLVDAPGGTRRIDADPSAQRRRPPPPLRGRKRGGQASGDLLRVGGIRTREQPAGDRRVLPYEGLAIPEELVVRLGERLAAKRARGLIVTLRDHAGRLAGRALDQPSGEAPRGK